MTGGYAGYEEWKGWSTRRFSPTAEERAYFRGEMRDLAIRGADVLEIGFGAGHFVAWAQEEKARIHGTEIQESLCAAAREAGIPVLPAALQEAAESHREAFDTVVALDVFEHLTPEEVTQALHAVERMLRPGGRVLLRFPNAQSPFGLAPQYGDPTHRSALSRGVIERLMQGTSLTVRRYGPAFRLESGPLPARAARILRHRLRAVIGALLGAIYATDIPWDPVVTLVLVKAEERHDR